jgi:hypothetical protein
MRRGLLFALLLAAVALPALAQTDAAETAAADVTEYGEKEWVAPLVEGDLVRPDGSLITGRRGPKSSSLITVRTSFRTEILKSVENL